MDKNMKSFLLLSGLLTALLVSITTLFGYIYNHYTIYTYQYILLIAIILIIIITAVFILSLAAVFHTYRSKRANRYVLWLIRFGFNVVLPFTALISGAFKLNKDPIRNFFIRVNNIIVQSGIEKYEADKVILLLPHCLQYSECTHKITNSISNCKKCGKCCIGEIVELVEKVGINAFVATGGTVARNLVAKIRPKLVLSVACERDLTSGIAEVGGIPVIGLVNLRPNGPCHNTTVDVEALREYLIRIVRNGIKV